MFIVFAVLNVYLLQYCHDTHFKIASSANSNRLFSPPTELLADQDGTVARL